MESLHGSQPRVGSMNLGCLLSRPSDTLSSARSGGEGRGEEVPGKLGFNRREQRKQRASLSISVSSVTSCSSRSAGSWVASTKRICALGP